jgi:hypothetical protein
VTDDVGPVSAAAHTEGLGRRALPSEVVTERATANQANEEGFPLVGAPVDELDVARLAVTVRAGQALPIARHEDPTACVVVGLDRIQLGTADLLLCLCQRLCQPVLGIPVDRQEQ